MRTIGVNPTYLMRIELGIVLFFFVCVLMSLHNDWSAKEFILMKENLQTANRQHNLSKIIKITLSQPFLNIFKHVFNKTSRYTCVVF